MLQPKNRILIIDDNPMDRRVVSSLLKSMSLTDIAEAEAGDVAEEKINTSILLRKPFHLLILDWNMRNVNGPKLLERLNKDQRVENLKVMIMTGSADRDVVDQAISLGVDDFLVKPLDKISFKTKIEKLLGIA